MSILVKPQSHQIDSILRPLDITPQSAGWEYVSFTVYHLVMGQTLRGAANGRETAVVVLSGIGQGELQVTPLQNARWTAAVATGNLVTPRLGLAIGGKNTPYTALPAPVATPVPFAAALGPVREGGPTRSGKSI